MYIIGKVLTNFESMIASHHAYLLCFETCIMDEECDDACCCLLYYGK